MTPRDETRRLNIDYLRLGKVIARLVLYAICIFLALMFIFPFFYTVMSSLKQPREMFAWPPVLIPESFQWQNYATVFDRVPFMRWFWNTVALAVLATTGGVLTSSLVAFSFARFDYRGRDILFMITLSTMMLPAQVTLIPQFILFFKLGQWTPIQFLDTLRPLWVPAWFGGGAFGIFLMRQFIQTIPNELDEAALMDGASYPRIFSTIILPLCKPVIATLAIITFLGSWNSFIGPMIYINTTEKFPISVGVQYFKKSAGGMSMEDPQEHLLMCASVLSTIVPIAVFFSAQNVFVKGVVMTGIKG
jgi:multiple sugar transport system permease protein